MLKKRIPTIVALVLLLMGALAGVVFINQKTDFLPRAAPEYAPQKVKITNLSENGFTVSWITQEPTLGFVKYGESAGGLSVVAVDERDQLTGKSNEYRTHYITLQNLKPSTTYYFKLGSQKNQLYDNNGQPFQLTTPNTLGTPPPADTAYGTVQTAAETPAEGAVVYVSLQGATPVSALVKQNGNWAVNLSTARSADLQSYAVYDPQTSILDILVQPSTGELAKATTTTNNNKPVPTMTLGQVYDFSKTQAAATPVPDLNPEPTPVPDSKFSMQSIQATEGEIDPTINITTIPKDGTVVNSVQPEIKGKAPAGASLTITVHSNQAYTDQVQASEDGGWSWVPPGNLEPGDHTVTVSYTDSQGILHKVTRQFVVDSAANVQPLYEDPFYSATPAATIEPSPTMTPKPTPTPRPTVTPKPRTVVSTASADLKAGTTANSIILLLMGSMILGVGWFLSKRQN